MDPEEPGALEAKALRQREEPSAEVVWPDPTDMFPDLQVSPAPVQLS